MLSKATPHCIRSAAQVSIFQSFAHHEVAADLGMLNTTLRGEAVELVRPRGERAGVKLWIGVDDLERLATDRSCGAENRDPLHDQSLRVSL